MLLGVKIFEKGLTISLFSLICFSCTSTPRQWQHASNKGTHVDFRSSRLYLAPENDFSGLEVDMLDTSQGRVIYVNAFGLQLQPEGKSPEGHSTISVKIKINEHLEEFVGFLLQGGHRILLPNNATYLIIEALHSDKKVEISVAHYSTTVIPDNFANCFQKLSG